MITCNMRAFGLIYARQLKHWLDQGLSVAAAIVCAAGDANEQYPLEPAEISEIREMMRNNSMGELLS